MSPGTVPTASQPLLTPETLTVGLNFISLLPLQLHASFTLFRLHLFRSITLFTNYQLRTSETSHTMASPSGQGTILIVGGGVFGLSTALELSYRGYKNITVLDRHLPPVPDGSSVDTSRAIRPDYADEFYARMGLEALDGWKNEYSEFFNRSGLLCVQSQGSTVNPYIDQSKRNLEKLGIGRSLHGFEGNEVTKRYPGIHGNLSITSGYWNTESGWADAERSIAHLARKCTIAGVSFIAGRNGTVTGLITKNMQGRQKKKMTGVRTLSDTAISADMGILATGAWTPHLLNTGNRSISTAQPIGFMQLTPSEAEEMRDNPVILDLNLGFLMFPPTRGDNVLKMTVHGHGFVTTHKSPNQANDSFSAPKMTVQRPFLPEDGERGLRAGLALFLPKFQNRPFMKRRLCWYTDTPKGDFIVDYHPEYENLFIATGGSGQYVHIPGTFFKRREIANCVHSGFKFLPVLGRYIANSFEGKASEEQQKKWAWTAGSGSIMKGDGSRGGPARRVLSRDEQARL